MRVFNFFYSRVREKIFEKYFLQDKHCCKKFFLSTLLEFELHLPHFLPVPIFLEGKVVDVRKKKEVELFETRVKFIDLTELAQEALELIEKRNT